MGVSALRVAAEEILSQMPKELKGPGVMFLWATGKCLFTIALVKLYVKHMEEFKKIYRGQLLMLG